jgi:hypothetical protein
MTDQEPDDTHSSRGTRVILAVITLILGYGAVFLVDGWLTWFLAALAVLVGCIAMCPPFRNPT